MAHKFALGGIKTNVMSNGSINGINAQLSITIMRNDFNWMNFT